MPWAARERMEGLTATALTRVSTWVCGVCMGCVWEEGGKGVHEGRTMHHMQVPGQHLCAYVH
jgi:hypothetical protein